MNNLLLKDEFDKISFGSYYYQFILPSGKDCYLFLNYFPLLNRAKLQKEFIKRKENNNYITSSLVTENFNSQLRISYIQYELNTSGINFLNQTNRNIKVSSLKLFFVLDDEILNKYEIDRKDLRYNSFIVSVDTYIKYLSYSIVTLYPVNLKNDDDDDSLDNNNDQIDNINKRINYLKSIDTQNFKNNLASNQISFNNKRKYDLTIDSNTPLDQETNPSVSANIDSMDINSLSDNNIQDAHLLKKQKTLQLSLSKFRKEKFLNSQKDIENTKRNKMKTIEKDDQTEIEGKGNEHQVDQKYDPFKVKREEINNNNFEKNKIKIEKEKEKEEYDVRKIKKELNENQKIKIKREHQENNYIKFKKENIEDYFIKIRKEPKELQTGRIIKVKEEYKLDEMNRQKFKENELIKIKEEEYNNGDHTYKNNWEYKDNSYDLIKKENSNIKVKEEDVSKGSIEKIETDEIKKDSNEDGTDDKTKEIGIKDENDDDKSKKEIEILDEDYDENKDNESEEVETFNGNDDGNDEETEIYDKNVDENVNGKSEETEIFSGNEDENGDSNDKETEIYDENDDESMDNKSKETEINNNSDYDNENVDSKSEETEIFSGNEEDKNRDSNDEETEIHDENDEESMDNKSKETEINNNSDYDNENVVDKNKEREIENINDSENNINDIHNNITEIKIKDGNGNDIKNESCDEISTNRIIENNSDIDDENNYNDYINHKTIAETKNINNIINEENNNKGTKEDENIKENIVDMNSNKRKVINTKENNVTINKKRKGEKISLNDKIFKNEIEENININFGYKRPPLLRVIDDISESLKYYSSVHYINVLKVCQKGHLLFMRENKAKDQYLYIFSNNFSLNLASQSNYFDFGK
jgi:hypothetical protein